MREFRNHSRELYVAQRLASCMRRSSPACMNNNTPRWLDRINDNSRADRPLLAIETALDLFLPRQPSFFLRSHDFAHCISWPSFPRDHRAALQL